MEPIELNIGCGSSFAGDVRIDIRKTKAANLLADAHFLPFKNESFSNVICTEVLEHLKSPFQALEEVHRVLIRNGIAFLTVPNLTEIRRILSITKKPLRVRHIETDHKQGWDAIEFSRLASQVGLQVIEIDWIDLYGRKKMKEKFKFLNPLLKNILPKPLYYTHMKIICLKNNYTRGYPMPR